MGVEENQIDGYVGPERLDQGSAGDRGTLKGVGVQPPAAHPAFGGKCGAQRLHQLTGRADPGQVDARGEVQAHHRVDVTVDQPGSQGGRAQVEDLGVVAAPGGHVVAVTDGGDGPAGDRHRPGRRAGRVKGVHVAGDQDQVGCGTLPSSVLGNGFGGSGLGTIRAYCSGRRARRYRAASTPAANTAGTMATRTSLVEVSAPVR